MFAHIQVGAKDAGRLGAFYDRVLGVLGLVRMSEDEAAGIVWQQPGRRWPQFVVRRPFNGEPATVGNGFQVSFATPSRETVDAVWQAALAAGGSDEGKPGLRRRYADDFYAAYCRDPEGNKICFVTTDDM